MQRGFNGSGGAVHGGGGLVGGEVLKVAEDQHLALAGAEQIERGLHRTALVLALNFADLRVGRCDLRLGVGIEVLAALAAKLADDVQRDPLRPGLELAFAAERGDLAEEAQPRFLCRVGGEIGIAKLGQSEAIPHVLEGCEKLPACSAVATTGGIERCRVHSIGNLKSGCDDDATRAMVWEGEAPAEPVHEGSPARRRLGKSLALPERIIAKPPKMSSA